MDFIFSVVPPEAGKSIRGAGEALPALSFHVGDARLSLAASRTYLSVSKRARSVAFIKEATRITSTWTGL